MPYNITSPRQSFIQFAESDDTTSCQFADINQCLPVYEADDIWFQFFITTDSVEEADALCDLTNSAVTVGLYNGGDLLTFAEKPDRYRIGERQLLYNWQHGVPGFDTVRQNGECFVIKVDIGGQSFTTNCLQRIGSDCHTSVLEYGNDDNAFGFNYCSSEGIDTGESVTCEPRFISFINQSTLVIPYTTSMLEDYGPVPTIKVWIYDETGELVNMSVRQALDDYPPTEIRLDFGGPATGYLKIS